MKNTAPAHTGRHFLQIPGPTNVPDRVLQAIAMPTIDHRGPEFAALGQEVVAGMKRVFQTDDTVVVYPSSGTGAWEAALSNTLSPGDHVIMFETGHFATLWRQMAARLGLEVEFVPGDWRHGVDPALVEEKLTADREHRLKAVCVVHNETSTGVDEPHRRDPRGDRPGRPSGALHGRHDFLARLDRLPPRRMEGRRHGRRLAEGADAAAGARLQRGLEEGAGGSQDGAAAALLLGLGGDARDRAHRLFPLHAGDQPAVRAARGAEDAARRGGAAGGVPPPRPPRRGDAARGRRLGSRSPVRRSARAFELADRDPGSRRVRRRPAARDHPRMLRHVARHRSRQTAGARCSASAISAISTI